MNVLDSIYNFQLEFLPADWVESVWNSDFNGEKDIPDDYLLQVEDKDFSECMLQLIASLNSWKGNERDSFVGSTNSDSRSNSPIPESFKKSWHTLSQCKVNHKALLCLLSTFTRNDTTELKDENMRHLAFTASRLYLNMLSIPGAIAFNVFNSLLFDQAMMVLKLGNVFINVNSGKNARKNSKGKKKQQIQAQEEQESDTHNSSISFTDAEKEEILDEILLLLRDLSHCLKELQLKDEIDSVINLIQLLIGLTRLETETNIFVKSPRVKTIGNVAQISYSILEDLCVPEHGDIVQTVLSIMSCFLPTLVINEQNVKMSLKEHTAVKEHTFSFIGNILVKLGAPAAPGVKALVQQMCVRMPEKADIRNKGLPEIVNFIKLFPTTVFQELVLWIISLGHEEIVRYRTCAIELISRLLNVSDKTDDDGTPHTCQTNDSNTDESLSSEKELILKLLFAAVLSRCLDISPLVRYKSLGILGNLIITNHPQIKKVVGEIFTPPGDDAPEAEEKGLFDFGAFFKQKEKSLPNNPLPSGVVLIRYIEKFALDDKVYVRKNSLNIIANLCLLNEKWITEKRTKMLVDSCKDNSVMIRKLVSKCLTDLVLKYPERKDFIQAWVRGVLSLMADNEIKSQEKVIEYTEAIVVHNMEMHGRSSSPLAKLPWLVLNEISIQGKRSLFRFACKSWTHKSSITPNFLKIIRSHVGTENNLPVWLLIVSLSEFRDVPFPDVIYDYYFDNIHSGENVEEYLSQLVIEALFLNWRKLDEEAQEKLYSKFSSALENFSVAVPLISRTLDTCWQMKEEETKELCSKLIEACEDYIEKRIVPGCTRHINEQAISKYIYTLGDAVHFHPGVRTDTINSLANLIDPAFITDENVQKWEGSASANVRAFAVVTLGKICLQDLFVARTYVPVLGSLLKNPDTPEAVKINATVALSDLCIRFTSVVEEYLGCMCLSLKDSNLRVRMNTLKMLMQLIQEDYIKLKGSLFYYLLTMILDPSPVIKELVESFIVTSVLTKNPGILANNYVGAVLFFNDFEGKEGYSSDKISLREKAVFSLAGVNNFQYRGKIYRFMLEHMADDHRFKTCNRLCFDILEDVVEIGNIGFDSKGVAVIKDTLYSLACEEMRLEHLRKEDDEHEAPQAENVVFGIAKKVLLSQIVKRNYIDNVIPIIVKLKRLLLEKKSPLVRDLMICLRELMKDYKEEINEILSTDPDLAAEVALDLKNVSTEDIIVEEFEDLNIKEVRLQCEKLSDRALIEAMGESEAANGSSQAEVTDSPTSSPPVPVRSAETSSVSDEIPVISASSIVINSTMSPSMTEGAPTSSDTIKGSRKSKQLRLSQVNELQETSNSIEEPSKKRRSHEALESSPVSSEEETTNYKKKVKKAAKYKKKK